jgi:hypothetical protein
VTRGGYTQGASAIHAISASVRRVFAVVKANECGDGGDAIDGVGVAYNFAMLSSANPERNLRSDLIT